ncbi:hypothetical protein [cyanobacterium endosymbiont of Rhopalodia gibberula]|uniref:hypothetical protein n=1 Tax=cyanobacterium endosymbiont of Rhopalodia gibberula TaxID=1763363 RepID=UPI0015584601|nr:hypothetical protein [cyanobacterium endosymbiont of Rhopalodia gibberula]
MKDLAEDNFLVAKVNGTKFGKANVSRTSFRDANLMDAVDLKIKPSLIIQGSARQI